MKSYGEMRCPSCDSPLLRAQNHLGRLMICSGCEKSVVITNKSDQIRILEKCVFETEAKAAIQRLPLHARLEAMRGKAENAKKIATAQRTRVSGLAIVLITAIIAFLALFLQPGESSHAIILEYIALRFVIVSALAVLLFSEYYRSTRAEQTYSVTFPEVRQIYFMLLEEYYARLAGTSILDEDNDDDLSRQHQGDPIPQ